MDKLKRIEQNSAKLLKSFNLFNVAIDIELLAKKMNIILLKEDLEDSLSGFLVIKNRTKTVVINKHHHSNRQRFTLAHEIGHLELHADSSKESLFLEKRQIYNRNIISSTGTNRQEIEANYYAACLLMPEKLIKKHLKQENDSNFINDFNGDSNSIEELAKTFEVSTVAFSHRLSSLIVSA